MAQLNLEIDQVREKSAKAKSEIIEKLALQIEAQCKANIVENNQVDTGFMLNSVYAITTKTSTYGQANSSAQSKNPKARIAPEAALGDADGAVAVGAEYAIVQETRHSFLYKAGEQVARQAGATIEKVGGEVFNE